MKWWVGLLLLGSSTLAYATTPIPTPVPARVVFKLQPGATAARFITTSGSTVLPNLLTVQSPCGDQPQYDCAGFQMSCTGTTCYRLCNTVNGSEVCTSASQPVPYADQCVTCGVEQKTEAQYYGIDNDYWGQPTGTPTVKSSVRQSFTTGRPLTVSSLDVKLARESAESGTIRFEVWDSALTTRRLRSADVTLTNGTTTSATYHVAMPGTLPAGTYVLVMQGTTSGGRVLWRCTTPGTAYSGQAWQGATLRDSDFLFALYEATTALPTPVVTALPTGTRTATPISTVTRTVTPTQTSTPVPTSTTTRTPIATPTGTRTSTPVATWTPLLACPCATEAPSSSSSTRTSTPLPTVVATPNGTFWDASGIPPAQNVMMFKLLNRTNGQYDDAHVFWSVSINGVKQTHSFAEQNLFDMPANAAGRMYFYLGKVGQTNTDYYDFIEYTIGTAQFNGNTTRVDAFGIKIAMLLHNADGTEQLVGEDAKTFAESRATTFQRFIDAVPDEFKALATGTAPYRILNPGWGGFDKGGAHQDYYSAYIDAIWAINGLTIPKAGANASGLGSYPNLSAGIYRHTIPVDQVTFSPDGKLLNQSMWADPSTFYLHAPADYYAKFWHDNAIDGKAYGFPYDDVGGYSSYISHKNPQYMLVAVGW